MTLKVRYPNFQIQTRSQTLPQNTADADTIFQAVKLLLPKAQSSQLEVRLLGVGLSHWDDAHTQQLTRF